MRTRQVAGGGVVAGGAVAGGATAGAASGAGGVAAGSAAGGGAGGVAGGGAAGVAACGGAAGGAAARPPDADRVLQQIMRLKAQGQGAEAEADATVRFVAGLPRGPTTYHLLLRDLLRLALTMALLTTRCASWRVVTHRV